MDVERQTLETDIACVGFGPATGGFLTTLSRALTNEDGTVALESRVMPGMPLQVVCYERADDIAFGVSGAATRARGIRRSFPDLDPSAIPLAQRITREKVLYLLDPVGASRRTRSVRALDAVLGALPAARRDHAIELPWIPPFLRKHDGFVFSLGQFNQWVGSRLAGEGLVQIWPGMPVAEAVLEDGRVAGVRLLDQGTDRAGNPDAGYLPGMDVRAALTVVADGPVGAVGRQLDERFGMPEGHGRDDWAVGMKMVVDLPGSCTLEPGTVLHTFGYPEPEIFGFLYVHPGGVASLGIFVPNTLDSPVRTSYRYLQHWMRHPALFRHLEGGTMRSWGAKSIQESGRRGEPKLAGDGWARIGEGSGSTNVLTGSGVDEAWTTGVQLAEGVIELLRAERPLDAANLEQAYVRRRRESWVEREGRVAEHARAGFRRGFLRGLFGMGLSGLTGGKLHLAPGPRPGRERVPSLEEWCAGRIPADEVQRLRRECAGRGVALHDAVMDRLGWPAVEPDGKLFVSHQDALLLGGKVQAPAGYADHVVFLYPHLCERCDDKLCVEICSGQAITPGENGVPRFDREKCVHCGACLWSCQQRAEGEADRGNLAFRTGAGGLHTVEN
jgi:electron-transferring-flavoprotein dehydrogenase